MPTPRTFVIRHGETEWSLNGRHTGTSELPLTSNGEKRIRATGRAMVGDDRLIVPKKLAHVYVSPRHRAQRTLELLDLGCRDRLPWSSNESDSESSSSFRTAAKIQVTADIREWDYGDYEGITSAEIAEQRRTAGLPPWDIWRDGCPGGESPADVTERVDRLIKEIRETFQGPVMVPGVKSDKPADILLVAHGHILRAFAMRWAGKQLVDGPIFLLEAGGVGTLSYEHGRVEEPAILLGGAFIVDMAEKEEEEKEKAR